MTEMIPVKNKKETEALSLELSDEELKKLSAEQQTCGGFSSVGFPQADDRDYLSVSTTKSWFSTVYE